MRSRLPRLNSIMQFTIQLVYIEKKKKSFSQMIEFLKMGIWVRSIAYEFQDAQRRLKHWI